MLSLNPVQNITWVLESTSTFVREKSEKSAATDRKESHKLSGEKVAVSPSGVISGICSEAPGLFWLHGMK